MGAQLLHLRDLTRVSQDTKVATYCLTNPCYRDWSTDVQCLGRPHVIRLPASIVRIDKQAYRRRRQSLTLALKLITKRTLGTGMAVESPVAPHPPARRDRTATHRLSHSNPLHSLRADPM